MLAKVERSTGALAVAAEGGAQQREQRLVLVDRQELAVAQSPTLRGEVEGHEAEPSVIVIVPTPLAGTMFPVMLELSVAPWPETVPAATPSSRWLPTVSVTSLLVIVTFIKPVLLAHGRC